MSAYKEVPTTLEDGVNDVLERLGDLDNKGWSRSEIQLYLQDGYDQFCARTMCLFDRVVIENLPVTGNWQTDLERYLAEHKAGFGLTDRPFHFTGEHERNLSVGTKGEYAGSYSGPAPATSPTESFSDTSLRASGEVLPSVVPGGEIPDKTLSVVRVSYDQRTLKPLSSQQLRVLDPNYETRTGDPQWYTWGKDGIFYVRVVPAASGTATYDTVSGSWGSLSQRLDSDSDVEDTIDDGGHGGWGILVHRDDTFPAFGPWGTPTRIHPDTDNVVVEIYRLGRTLTSYPFELPRAYLKYVYYYAMGQALERRSSGEDLELAKHYYDRFEMGVDRLIRRKREANRELVRSFEPSESEDVNFGGLGDPQAPYPYGKPF